MAKLPYDIFESGMLLPKTDEEGRIYRECRCPNCHAWLADEYVRRGRLRLKCFRCGKVILMVFGASLRKPKSGRTREE